MKTAPLFRGVLLSLAFTAAHSAELPGAQALLDRVAAERSQTTPKTNQPNNAVTELRQSLTNFIQKRAALTPADAAAQWTALVTKATSLPQSRTLSAQLNFSEVLDALPEPPAWPELEKIWESREIKTPKDLALRLISARLVNQTDKAVAAVEAFAKSDETPESYFVGSLLEALNGRKGQTREAVLKQLDRLVGASARGERNLDLPRLVPIVSEDEAFEAFKAVLPKIKAPVTVYSQRQADYPWKAALAVVDQLPIAQWSLVYTPKAAALYEALDKKFGAAAAEDEDAPTSRFGGSSEIGDARIHYLSALLSQGEIAKAVELARKHRMRNLYFDSDSEPPAAALTAFYLELLKQDPTARHWSALSLAAAKAGKTADALKLAEDSISKPNLSEAQRADLKRVIMRAKLADDQVDAALASLTAGEDDERQTSILEIAYLGAALKKNDLMKQAVALASQGRPEERFGYGVGGETIALTLSRHGLVAEALDFAVKNLAQAKGRGATWLQTIASIYVEQGRPADALVLLENSPDWAIDDVAKTLRPELNFNHGYNLKPLSLHYITAAALAGANREAEALAVLRQSLFIDAGNDRAYELLLKLAGQNAAQTLDELFAIDRFEERPLIWKAVLQQRAGRLDTAEKTIREAIAIDPSDGEQGPGDRLRAYAVLADILAAKGDPKQAEQLRGAVAAIRLSEEADLDFAAGLLRRAIGKYRDSLKLFADAYCVQARLAVQMSALGLNEEAEEHYRRAFELMPDSFGRVESHCFGCEHAFGGEKAQGIAEKVFTGLLQKSPDKAQLHYLLGYLREQQQRFPEALTHFKDAVKRDPDYLNAWKHLASLGDNIHMTPQETDDAALNLLRLDPAGRHAAGRSQVNDLARLWEAIKANAQKIPEPPARLFALKATAEQLEKLKASRPGGFERYEEYSRLYNPYSQGAAKNPAKAIAQDQIIASAAMLLGGAPHSID